ncbi:MAG: hypothetical protein R3B13_30965 [Polyangiaceae bacterium]
MRAWRLAFLVIGLTACGGGDDAGLFTGGGQDAGLGGGGSGATGGASTGGASGSGGIVASGGSSTGGVGTGGAATGGSAGVGGAATGGLGSGGVGTGGAGAGGVGTGGASTGGASSGGTGGGPTGPSCEGKCGSTSPQPLPSGGQCFCDSVCLSYNDCCPSWSKACNATSQGSVNCADDKCNTASEFCCYQYSNQSDSYTPACLSNGSSCVGPDIFCDDPSDCASGQVCCASLQGTTNPFVAAMQCRATSDCRDDQNRLVVCGDSGTCPANLSCAPMKLGSNYNLPQYKVCQ